MCEVRKTENRLLNLIIKKKGEKEREGREKDNNILTKAKYNTGWPLSNDANYTYMYEYT